MPFKDTKDGQTHFYNDGCGDPAHNDMQNQYTSYKLSKKLDEVGFDPISLSEKLSKQCFGWWGLPEASDYDCWCFYESMPTEFYYADSDVKAYDLIWDLCIHYKDEVWGEELELGEIDYQSNLQAVIPNIKQYEHFISIIQFLQQGDKQSAEDYILENSILFK